MFKQLLAASAGFVLALSVQAQGYDYINIGYPATITVTQQPESDPTRRTFVVDLNDDKIASFHVQSSLVGEQHYGQTRARSTPDLTGPTIEWSTLVGAWTFSAQEGSFAWQSEINRDRYQGLWVFEVSNVNFTADTTFTYWFDYATPSGTVVTPIPEPSTYVLMLSTLGVMALCVRRAPRS